MLGLAPDLLATPGYRFTATGGPYEECDGCPVQKLCFAPEAGRHMEVKAVRSVVHPCNLHEGGMRVVELDEASFATTLEAKRLRGTAATYSPPDCGHPTCPNWKLCHPVGPTRDVRYAVESVGEAVDCPMHYNLKRVHIKRV
ncbi:MAG: UPF0179 family protein [Thermoplasmatota archaeon]